MLLSIQLISRETKIKPIHVQDPAIHQRHLRRFLREEASALGFDTMHIAAIDRTPDNLAALREFLDNARHGDMDWLARSPETRAAPRRLWKQAQSAIVLGMNYGVARNEDPLSYLADAGTGGIALYARRADYHTIIKKKLKSLARRLIARAGGEVKVFVDTAPVMEKPLAQQAGTGWQGKHTNLVSRQYGSWLFLGSIFTTLAIPPDPGETDHCGSCRRCLDVCPTNAFVAPYKLDARLCISYLTIEHKGHIPRHLRAPMGNRIFGCDDCLAVCPWNRFAGTAREARLAIHEHMRAPALGTLVRLDDDAFRRMFAGTPVKRTGRERFVRNVLIAIGNGGDRTHVPDVVTLLADASALVRAAAVWSLGRLLDAPAIRDYHKRYAPHETDPQVRAEWDDALTC